MARVVGVSDDLLCFPHTSLDVDVVERGEAHLRRSTGPSELFYAGLSGWERCSSRTRQRWSQSVCSPQCNCRTVFFKLRPNFFSHLRKRLVGLPRYWPCVNSLVRSSVMFTARNLMLLTRSTRGGGGGGGGGPNWSASWNPPPAP